MLNYIQHGFVTKMTSKPEQNHYNNTTTLSIYPYNWEIRDDDHVDMSCWELNPVSKPYVLRITDFTVFSHNQPK